MFVCVSLCVHVEANEQQLIFSGQQLENSRLLSDYGVKDDSVIYMFLWDVIVNPSNKDGEMGDKRTRNQSKETFLICKTHSGYARLCCQVL